MEGLLAPGLALRIGLVPAADLAVEVPAGVVEGLGQSRDLVARQPLQVDEGDHHVGQLDAGVVDVVLDLYRVAEAAQGADQDVAQNGVPQVADVGRLVGVDVGVLDDDLAAAGRLAVVAVGKATRLLRFVEKTRKGYIGEVVLGSSTSTLDSAGDVVATFDMSAVTLDLPERSVVNASMPASVAAGNVETSQRIVDVVLGALAQALPGQMPAASQGTMNNVIFGDDAFGYYETIAGGCGAGPVNDSPRK